MISMKPIIISQNLIIFVWLLIRIIETESAAFEDNVKLGYMNYNMPFTNEKESSQDEKRLPNINTSPVKESYRDLEMWEVSKDRSYLRESENGDSSSDFEPSEDTSDDEEYNEMCPCTCNDGNCELLQRDIRESSWETNKASKVNKLWNEENHSILLPSEMMKPEATDIKNPSTQRSGTGNSRVFHEELGNCRDAEMKTMKKVVYLIVPMLVEEVRRRTKKNTCQSQAEANVKDITENEHLFGESHLLDMGMSEHISEDNVELKKFRQQFYNPKENVEKETEQEKLFNLIIESIERLALQKQFLTKENNKVEKNSSQFHEVSSPDKTFPANKSPNVRKYSITLATRPEYDSLVFPEQSKNKPTESGSATSENLRNKDGNMLSVKEKDLLIKNFFPEQKRGYSDNINPFKSIRIYATNYGGSDEIKNKDQLSKDHLNVEKDQSNQRSDKKFHHREKIIKEDGLNIFSSPDHIFRRSLTSDAKRISKNSTSKDSLPYPNKLSLPKAHEYLKAQSNDFKRQEVNSSVTLKRTRDVSDTLQYVVPSIACLYTKGSVCWLEKQLGDTVILAAKVQAVMANLQYEVSWSRHIKVYKSEEMIEILDEDIPGYLSFSSDRLALRIRYLTDNDMYYNSYRIHIKYIQSSDPEMGNIYTDLGSVIFRINIVPFDVGVVKGNEKVLIDISDYVMFDSHQSYLVGWLVEDSFDKGKLIPDNMKENKDGSVLIIENDPQEFEWIINGIVYDIDGRFLARRRFRLQASHGNQGHDLTDLENEFSQHSAHTLFNKRRLKRFRKDSQYIYRNRTKD